MYHLDNSSGVATRPDIPAVKNAQVCWFTEGGNGVPPSYPGAHWFNIIQAELLNVLNEAGVSPQKAQLNQLTIAIKKIIDNKSQNYVAKSGDTMTGPLNINHATSYLRGKNNGADDWFVGRVRNNDNDVALASYQNSTGVHLKADRVESSKPLYRGTNQVFDEGNLQPVRHINLRSHIPNTQIEYQNATPSELPLGSYAGFTTNAQLSGSGTFGGWGFVSKIDNVNAFRQAVNLDRFFAQWGYTTSGWGSVYEYFMLRPQLGASDLNTVTVYGIYAQTANANALPDQNYPVQEAGTLIVTPSAYGYQQEYTTFYTNKKFVRGRTRLQDGYAWNAWRRIDALDSVSKAGDQMDSLEINQGHKITTSHYGLGSYAAQYDSGAPFFVSQNASVARNTYHPFVKGKVRSYAQHGAAFSFGYTTNQRTDGQDGFGRGVVHLAEDNGRNCVWSFEHDGSFIAGDVATFAGKRLSNAMMAGDVAVLTGEIAHGGTIPLPAGFTHEQCKWAVMPRFMFDRGGADINSFQVYADANRFVTVHTEGGVNNYNRATYIIVGIK